MLLLLLLIMLLLFILLMEFVIGRIIPNFSSLISLPRQIKGEIAATYSTSTTTAATTTATTTTSTTTFLHIAKMDLENYFLGDTVKKIDLIL